MTLSSSPTTINGQIVKVGQAAVNTIGRGLDVTVESFAYMGDELVGVMVREANFNTSWCLYMADPANLVF